jgi:hypothetical protein
MMGATSPAGLDALTEEVLYAFEYQRSVIYSSYTNKLDAVIAFNRSDVFHTYLDSKELLRHCSRETLAATDNISDGFHGSR